MIQRGYYPLALRLLKQVTGWCEETSDYEDEAFFAARRELLPKLSRKCAEGRFAPELILDIAARRY